MTAAKFNGMEHPAAARSSAAGPWRVGVDATPAGIEGGERGGVYQYIYQLARHLCRLAPDIELRLLFALPHYRHRQAIRRFVSSVGGRNVTAHRSPLPQRWLHRLRVPADIFLGRLDVFHSLAHVSPRCRSCPVVVTVHDLAFLHDLADRDMSRRLAPEGQHLWDVRRRFFDELTTNIARSVERAQIVIAVSHATARDLSASLSVPAGKIRVVHNGLRDDVALITAPAPLAEARRRHGLGEEDYWLYVGELDPNKNLPTMIEGYARYRQRGGKAALVIAGRAQFFGSMLQAQVDELGLTCHVHFLGYVGDAELPALYSGALGLAMPSPLEGFGLPALEAMACGTPVIAADAGALPEVVGDAGLLIEAFDAQQFAEAMQRLDEDRVLRADLAARGMRRAAQFSWERAALETLGVYAEAAGRR